MWVCGGGGEVWSWMSLHCFSTNIAINAYIIVVSTSFTDMFMSMAIPFEL